MTAQEPIKRKVISLDIDLYKYGLALARIVEAAKHGIPGYVCFSNVHMVIEAHKSKTYADQVNGATLVLPDGMPIVNALKLLYGIDQERIAGMDALPDLIRLAELNDLKIFFFGSTSDVLEKIRITTENKYPEVKIAGMFSPPFDTPLDNPDYIKLINNSGAKMVFIALGCPKQEKWMAAHSHKINAVLLGVGGAFPVYAGISRRAPQWLRDISLEWLFRLYQEPRRLFRRYFVTNSLFLYLIIKVKWQQKWNHRQL